MGFGDACIFETNPFEPHEAVDAPATTIGFHSAWLLGNQSGGSVLSTPMFIYSVWSFIYLITYLLIFYLPVIITLSDEKSSLLKWFKIIPLYFYGISLYFITVFMDFHCSNRAAQSKCFSRSFHPMFIDFNGRIPISEFRLGKEFRLSKKTLALFTYIIIIELDELKTYREPLYLMVKTMVSGSDFHLYIYIHISNKSPEGSSCIMGLCLFPVRILHVMLYHWISTLQAE